MSIQIINLDNGWGIVFDGTGEVTGQDIILANKKVLALKERMAVGRYCIIDYSKATAFSVSNEEIIIIANQDKKIATYLPYYTLAVVAPKALAFGLARMWKTVLEINGLSWETMIFRNIEDAKQWIRIKMKDQYNLEPSFTISAIAR